MPAGRREFEAREVEGGGHGAADQRPVADGQALIATIKRFRANPDEQLSIPSAVQLKAAEAAQDDDTESDILDIFLEEGDDLLEAMEVAIGRWEADRDNGAAIDDLQVEFDADLAQRGLHGLSIIPMG